MGFLLLLPKLAYQQHINTALLYNKFIKKRATLENSNVIINKVDTSNVDGVATVEINSVLGYEVNIPNMTLWTNEIRGKYVCGVNRSSFYFADKPDYKLDTDIDTPGSALVMGVALAITIVLTAEWPVLSTMLSSLGRIENNVDTIRYQLENISDNKKNPSEAQPDFTPLISCCACSPGQKSCLATTWMWLSMVFVLVISAMASQALCVALGWPNVEKIKRIGECYFIDESSAVYNNTKRITGSNIRRILSEDINLSAMNNETTEHASAFKTTGKGVKFTTSCDTGFFEADNGAIWTVVPPYAVKCRPVQAARILRQQSFVETKCTLGKWKQRNAESKLTNSTPNSQVIHVWSGLNMSRNFDYGGAGFTNPFIMQQSFFTLFDTLTTDDSDGSWRYCKACCGFLSLGNEWHRAAVSVEYTSMDNWSFCEVASTYATTDWERGVGYLVREKDGKTKFIKTTEFDYTNQYENRPYGWYTDGVSEVISYTNFDEGSDSALCFGDSATTIGVTQNTLNRLDMNSDAPRISTGVKSVNTNPARFACRQTFTMPEGIASGFEEWQSLCTNAYAQVDPVSGRLSITGSADGASCCSLILGFDAQDENGTTLTQSVVLQKDTAKTLLGVTSWSCQASSVNPGVGLNCDSREANGSFILYSINATLDDGIRRTITSNPQFVREERSSFEISGGISLGNLFGSVGSSSSSFLDTLIVAAISIGCLLLVGVISYGIFKLITYCSNKKHLDLTIESVAKSNIAHSSSNMGAQKEVPIYQI